MTSAELKHLFPWLGTRREVSGADVVADLVDQYEWLKKKERKERKSKKKTPAAFGTSETR
jgi:hypothetical protein